MTAPILRILPQLPSHARSSSGTAAYGQPQPGSELRPLSNPFGTDPSNPRGAFWVETSSRRAGDPTLHPLDIVGVSLNDTPVRIDRHRPLPGPRQRWHTPAKRIWSSCVFFFVFGTLGRPGTLILEELTPPRSWAFLHTAAATCAKSVAASLLASKRPTPSGIRGWRRYPIARLVQLPVA